MNVTLIDAVEVTSEVNGLMTYRIKQQRIEYMMKKDKISMNLCICGVPVSVSKNLMSKY